MPSGGSKLFILARGFQEFILFYFIFPLTVERGGDLRAGFSKWAPSSLRREIKNEQNQQKKKKPPRIYHGGIIPHRAALQIS